jgi:hypothetical protein
MAGMATLAPLARCTEPGCPWRWRTGPDRVCPDHDQDDPLRQARASLGLDAAALAELAAMAPGDRGADGRR